MIRAWHAFAALAPERREGIERSGVHAKQRLA